MPYGCMNRLPHSLLPVPLKMPDASGQFFRNPGKALFYPFEGNVNRPVRYSPVILPGVLFQQFFQEHAGTGLRLLPPLSFFSGRYRSLFVENSVTRVPAERLSGEGAAVFPNPVFPLSSAGALFRAGINIAFIGLSRLVVRNAERRSLSFCPERRRSSRFFRRAVRYPPAGCSISCVPGLRFGSDW